MRYQLTFGKQITEQILIHMLSVILTLDVPHRNKDSKDCRNTENQNTSDVSGTLIISQHFEENV